MTKSKGERLYRACIRCRQRKTKCDLYVAHKACYELSVNSFRQYTNEYNYYPCSKCFSEGHRCVVATSRRGGDYSRFRARKSQKHQEEELRECDRSEHTIESRAVDSVNTETVAADHRLGGIQNPLEALQILAQTAATERSAERRKTSMYQVDINQMSRREESNAQDSSVTHPARKSSTLLTTVLTIATKDRGGLEGLHTRISQYMEKLLLRVVLGAASVRHVGSVEGLLLLAEWVPHISTEECARDTAASNGPPQQVQVTEEDSVSWNLIGLAVRQAYLLHLERYSFRGESKDEDKLVYHRNRLAWIFTYLADRQISIQMGQAFWCRGPGLSTRFTIEDYPYLRPQKADGVDYASFVQAQVELTTIFGNIHDILYASKTRTVQLILMGDYTKYLDDSSKALAMWKAAWANVDLPFHLSGLLCLQFEYLRLYINAFAFQAVLYRTPKSPVGSDNGKTSYFPYSVMASADGRHIYIAIDAAKSVLKYLMERLNPTKHLRYIPVWFYLYEIHASVFLFKALTVGALSSEEQQTCTTLVRQFISMLKSAATSPSHIASRYSKLLTSLWFQGQTTPQTANDSVRLSGSAQNPLPSPIDLEVFANTSVIDSTGPFQDDFQTQQALSFLESTEGLECPDTFLSNLPFLRGGFPDLDNHGVGQLLMDL
ncbi:hypothetical protein AO1008_08873 [Aspergillus oryzae 100-8]|uniref:Xylanolytic transcriptional activator regulatory domain-containing protein n=1 Tax=Aspergillus oryzae (strain 3.042) TaxID=1160506 RepID=I8TSL2_ASPO3|nr:hypothetical protein Ao3042_06526 [Aspergillus oryzae 3.042]KDE82301.1 hypothetical protein AO1008_08873 [Aspergillus oryzae 100-8]|eukprot:EIT77320.1 hypothetical protein Ao3042_06526 [Aspergillus oryzae 3.042]